MIKDNYKLLHDFNETLKITMGYLFIKNGFDIGKYKYDYLIILKRIIYLTMFVIIWDYYYDKLDMYFKSQSTSSMLGEDCDSA